MVIGILLPYRVEHEAQKPFVVILLTVWDTLDR